jgi:hypothetical protein
MKLDSWLTNPAIVFIAFVALLAGCYRDNRADDIKSCTAQAQGHMLTTSKGASADDIHDQIGAVVADCMKAKGYSHDENAMSDARCIDDVDYSPYCYNR